MGLEDFGNAGLVLGLGLSTSGHRKAKKATILEPYLTLGVSGESCNDKKKICWDPSEEVDEDGANARKKLRLTKQQSALLEESFKQHTTLNPKQKQALARQLSLRPRQVEVWFQNRRARTKLKQTEVEYELLKKCSEALREENKRLQKEVQEYITILCPSCHRINTHLSNHFPNPC